MGLSLELICPTCCYIWKWICLCWLTLTSLFVGDFVMCFAPSVELGYFILGVYYKSTLVLVLLLLSRFWICFLCFVLFFKLKIEEWQKSILQAKLENCPVLQHKYFCWPDVLWRGTLTFSCTCVTFCFCFGGAFGFVKTKQKKSTVVDKWSQTCYAILFYKVLREKFNSL